MWYNVDSVGNFNLHGLGPNPLLFPPNPCNCFSSLPLVPADSLGGSGGGWKWFNNLHWGWKIGASILLIAGLAVATVATGGAASVILAGATIGAAGGFAGATISAGISAIGSGWDWNAWGNSALIGTAFGALSGAAGGTSWGLGAQIGINSALGVGNYAATSLISGNQMTLGGLVFNAFAGAIAGRIGGAGAMNSGTSLASVFTAFGGRNFFAAMSVNFSKKIAFDLLKEGVNAVIIGGALDGGYAQLHNIFNPYGNFIGW